MSALPRPIPKRGDVKGRWKRHQEDSRYAVFLRCKGVCEVPECHAEAREWAHLFGRRNILGEPWASSPACTMGLCRHHHQQIDRGLDPDLRDQLQWTGLVRLCQEEAVPVSLLTEHTPEGAARAVEELLKERGDG